MKKREFEAMLKRCKKEKEKKFLAMNGTKKPVVGKAVRYYNDDFKKGVVLRVDLKEPGSFREHWYPCEMLTEVQP